jgi:hypothetical protein
MTPPDLHAPQARTTASLTASFDTFDAQLRTFARERPVATLLGAAALGFVIGKIAARV